MSRTQRTIPHDAETGYHTYLKHWDSLEPHRGFLNRDPRNAYENGYDGGPRAYHRPSWRRGYREIFNPAGRRFTKRRYHKQRRQAERRELRQQED